MTTPARRMPLVDLLKAVSSQLIVLHHLAFYGPMSDIAYPLASGSIDWLYNYGRMAVQVFLVLAGYLAVRQLAPAGEPLVAAPLRLIWQRYGRLVLPLLAALALCVAAAGLARQWLSHPSVPAAPEFWQSLAHLFLLQNILDVEALSAGVWYVAIDFQLLAMLCLGLWLAGRGPASHITAPLLLTALAALALFHFNHDERWDDWGLYFFGSYALGAAAAWIGQHKRVAIWGLAILAVGVIALLLDFRLRIAIALTTALALGLADRSGYALRLPEIRLVSGLGRISYSLFLIHFPVCLLVNALFHQLAPNSAGLNLAGMGLAWLLSLAAGTLFYRWIELPLGRLKLPGATRQAQKASHA